MNGWTRSTTVCEMDISTNPHDRHLISYCSVAINSLDSRNEMM